MNSRNYSLLKKLFVLVALGIFFISCQEDDVNNPTDAAPEVPPVASMQMDFSPFSSASPLGKTNNSDTTFTRNNWAWASLNGIIWQTLITVGMSVPVAAFVESFNHDPEQQEDGRWLWTYEFTPFGGIKHTASLFADVSNDGVIWEMYITKAGVFEDFLWYMGESDLYATAGTWTIFHEPNNPTPWIGIEWERNTDDSTGSIKYTNIVPNGADNGGYIYYGITADLDYDAFYEIFNKGKENTISIKWNRMSHEGRVMDQNHFGNNEWHCWNSNLEDVDCQ